MKKMIKEYINKIAESYQIDKVYLFGSMARNDMDDNSDIDLVVVFDGKANLGDRFLNFILDIQKKFNRRADVITEKMLSKNPYFKKNVENDLEIIYG